MKDTRNMHPQIPFAPVGYFLTAVLTLAFCLIQPAHVRAQEYQLVLPEEQVEASPRTSQLLDFVELDYLGAGTRNHVTSPTLFAPVISYYGKQGVSREEMMRDRLAYYDKWPSRTYEMIPGSLQVNDRTADTVDVVFDYRFNVASARREIGGIGTSQLTIRLDDDGGYTILSEDGRVLKRY